MANIHGHDVEGDEKGIAYLHTLDANETRVLFEYARNHGHADFEDNETDINYTLHYSNGHYEVKRRGGGGAWF